MSEATYTDGELPHNRSGHSTTPPLVAGEAQIFEVLKTQGGGHGKIRKGLFPPATACIAKPLIPREETFYKRVQSTPLAECTPRYLGSRFVEGKPWLFLQDLTVGMTSPCIIDLKLGTRSFEVDAPPEKKLAQIEHMKNTTTASHAVRLIDARIRAGGVATHEWDRIQGHGLTPGEFQAVLRTFLPGKRRPEFVAGVMRIRQLLKAELEAMPKMRLYSASVLGLYDGDQPDSKMVVALIDFAHAYLDIDAEGGNSSESEFDDNSLKGLQSLISFLT